MTGIKDWSTTAALNNDTPPNGAPEGMDPGAVNDTMREIMAQIRTWLETAQWLPFSPSCTYVGDTQFKVTGDKTADYQVNRRVKAYGTTPFTIYGTISASAYSAPDTTVTVTWDSGSLNNTLSQVWLGAISASSHSLPAGLYQLTSAMLTSFVALTIAADKLPYGSGANAFSLTDFSAFARTILDDANAAAVRTTIAAQQTLSALAIGAITVATNDKVLVQDTSNSDALGTVTVQAIADLSAVKAAMYSYRLASGTVGPIYTGAGWRTVLVNTEDSDVSSIATLASNALTPIAGTYILMATVVSRDTNQSQRLRLQNTTDGTTAFLANTFDHPNDAVASISQTMFGVFTTAGSKAFEVQMYPESDTIAGTAFAGPGVDEQYTNITLIKIA